MKTTKEIIKDFTGKSDISIEQFIYDIARDGYALEKDQYQKWFSEEEIRRVFKRFHGGIHPNCNICKIEKELGVGRK